MNRRSQGIKNRMEDGNNFVKVDGVRYNISLPMSNVEEFEENEGAPWFGLGFNKPSRSDNAITDENDYEFNSTYTNMAMVYDVYVLRKYIEMTKEEHINQMIEEGDLKEAVTPEIKNILITYLNKIYDDNHMSDFADSVLNGLCGTDGFSKDVCFMVNGNRYFPEDVEYMYEDVLDSNTIFYPVIDGWSDELLESLRVEYKKIGWIESVDHEIDPYDSPSGFEEKCFLKIKEGAKIVR
jgi:hypothetical protein